MTNASSSNGSSSSNNNNHDPSLFLLVAAAAGGALTCLAGQVVYKKIRSKKQTSPETDHSVAQGLVWQSIGGALNASMLHIGDHLNLYNAMKELCCLEYEDSDSSGVTKERTITSSSTTTTAIELANATGLNQRWLREWLAQQAAMGILVLMPGIGSDDASLHYRLPTATAEVLTDVKSKHYGIGMVQAVPSLVQRSKTMLPEAFQSGIGRPYDDTDIAEAIDRLHGTHVKHIFLPKVLKPNKAIIELLERGVKVADLGCGAGNLIILLAGLYPKSEFHGFEISQVAIQRGTHNAAAKRLKNVIFHDANEPGQSLGDYQDDFDIALMFDVLHDATNPRELIRQVRVGLKEGGSWLLADIDAGESVRENIALPGADCSYGFSLNLCMSCALSEKGGEGLGTLGFSVSLANKMLKDEGDFSSVEVLLEEDQTRWFLVK